MDAVVETPHALNFAWLVRLRWGAIAGQAATVLAASRLMEIDLPMVALFSVIAVEALSNVAGWALQRAGRQPREGWLVAMMSLDTLVLTALLYLSGGPVNPFSFLYLVQIALAAVVLRARWTWMLVALSMAGSAVLFADSRPLILLGGSHEEHMSFHLRGMWVAFTVTAAFIVYSLLRVTRALADREADLAAARQAAERQEKLASLATLAAGAAHELASPLSTIRLTAKELERSLEAAAPELRAADLLDDVRLIRSQVERCREILVRMAADAGQTAGEAVESVPVGLLLERATQATGEATGGAGLRVDVDAEVASQRVRLPPRAVAEALRALIKNAQQASPSAAEVGVRATREAGRLRIEVRDRGPGMPSQVLARAGEPFFTTKAPGEGMGLGLFLVRELMQRLGGELAIDSRPGAGTAVVMRLPLEDTAANDGGAVPALATPSQGANNLRMGG